MSISNGDFTTNNDQNTKVSIEKYDLNLLYPNKVSTGALNQKYDRVKPEEEEEIYFYINRVETKVKNNKPDPPDSSSLRIIKGSRYQIVGQIGDVNRKYSMDDIISKNNENMQYFRTLTDENMGNDERNNENFQNNDENIVKNGENTVEKFENTAENDSKPLNKTGTLFLAWISYIFGLIHSISLVFMGGTNYIIWPDYHNISAISYILSGVLYQIFYTFLAFFYLTPPSSSYSSYFQLSLPQSPYSRSDMNIINILRAIFTVITLLCVILMGVPGYLESQRKSLKVQQLRGIRAIPNIKFGGGKVPTTTATTTNKNKLIGRKVPDKKLIIMGKPITNIDNSLGKNDQIGLLRDTKIENPRNDITHISSDQNSNGMIEMGDIQQQQQTEQRQNHQDKQQYEEGDQYQQQHKQQHEEGDQYQQQQQHQQQLQQQQHYEENTHRNEDHLITVGINTTSQDEDHLITSGKTTTFQDDVINPNHSNHDISNSARSRMPKHETSMTIPTTTVERTDLTIIPIIDPTDSTPSTTIPFVDPTNRTSSINLTNSIPSTSSTTIPIINQTDSASPSSPTNSTSSSSSTTITRCGCIKLTSTSIKHMRLWALLQYIALSSTTIWFGLFIFDFKQYCILF